MIRSATYQKYLQENLVTMRNGRYVVPVRQEYRNEVKGLVHDTSGSGQTLFIEPIAVVELNNEIKVLESREREEIERIITELSQMAGEHAESIQGSYDALLELDLYFAKAQLGAQYKGSVPKVNGEGRIHLKKARHPLIAKNQVVPIDIELGEQFNALIITGPNTGGKTVSLKTLGLFCLMGDVRLDDPRFGWQRGSGF